MFIVLLIISILCIYIIVKMIQFEINVKKEGESNIGNTFKRLGIILISGIVLFVCVFAMIVSGTSNRKSYSSYSSHSSYSNTCSSCGRSFSAGDSGGNYKNIASTGMCNNCYKNFKTQKSWGY